MIEFDRSREQFEKAGVKDWNLFLNELGCRSSNNLNFNGIGILID